MSYHVSAPRKYQDSRHHPLGEFLSAHHNLSAKRQLVNYGITTGDRQLIKKPTLSGESSKYVVPYLLLVRLNYYVQISRMLTQYFPRDSYVIIDRCCLNFRSLVGSSVD